MNVETLAADVAEMTESEESKFKRYHLEEDSGPGEISLGKGMD